jgi:NTE family protein
MTELVRRTPGVLVLGAGGILGEAWMSAVLAGLDEAEGFDVRDCNLYIGTSAGSIVAASLVAGIHPRSALGRLPEPPGVPAPPELGDGQTRLRQGFAAAAGLAGAVAAPLASFALGSTAPGGALLRRAALRRLPPGRRSLDDLARRVARSGPRWDGRLRIAVVELETGRRVILGAPRAPAVSVPEAVRASCAIPGVFRAVRDGGRTYVDGGAWSPTNMDAAEVKRGDRVLCLNPTGSLHPAIRELVGALGLVSRAIAAAEGLALRRRGASVTTVNPDEPSAAAMGTNFMDPRPREAVIEAGLAQGRRLGLRGESAG